MLIRNLLNKDLIRLYKLLFHIVFHFLDSILIYLGYLEGFLSLCHAVFLASDLNLNLLHLSLESR